MEESSRFTNTSLGITLRIPIVPHFRRSIISRLSMESACDIFHGIYDHGGQTNTINDLVTRLDFHALSITLLATAASRDT